MKMEEALHAILHEEPHVGFLERTQDGLEPRVLADLVRALRATAALPDGLVGVAQGPHWEVMDVCGTGGAKGSRLNTSTLTALFLPDLGVRVAKHGGRSASGKKGSLDLLDALGLEPKACFEGAAEALRSTGVCYLGAAFTYGCFARYAPLRKAFGKPTLFNLLGPLLNPTPLSTRLLGCRTRAVQDLLAQTLVHLGENALLVCSEDDEGPLDEGAPWSETRLVFVSSGQAGAGGARGAILQEALLPALEPKPAAREDLFADGVAAALALLEGKRTREADSAARMVGYNVALGVLAARRGLALADLAADAVRTLYADFLADLPARVERARARKASLSTLAALEGRVHADSPVKVPSTAAISTPAVSASEPRREHAGVSPRVPFPWQPERGLVIAEIKRQTPTRRFTSALSLESRVRAYDAAGADALSVVTHPSFQGDLSLLREVRSLTRKPLLAKDFIRTEEEALALVQAGADGVLILLDMVGEAQARRLADVVVAAGATPFVESTFEIPSFGIPMLNSRNLFTLREGRDHRDALARRLQSGVPFVVASSFSTPEEVVMARAQGGSVVVGGALMDLDTPSAVEAWVAKAKAGGLLKACGAQDADDARAALAAGARLVGVNLIPSSKRCLRVDALAGVLEDDALLAHTVFLTDAHTPRAVVDAVNASGKTFAFEQCYFAPRLRGARGLLHVGAQGAQAEGVPLPVEDVPFATARARILDGSQPGSGRVEPYPPHAQGHPRLPVFCAGGVTPDTAESRVREALRAGHAVCGFDAASGVESRGITSPAADPSAPTPTHVTPHGSRTGFDTEAVARLAALAQTL